ncbi:phosphoribosyltransferase family protein [Spirochaetota bacterium]
MGKEFLSYNTVRNNALKLAYRIYKDGFIPDIIYVSLRGGAYLGNVMSEYFKALKQDQRPVFYAAVVARSYIDIHKNDNVRIDGWTYSPEFLRNGDKVLLVDDIYDTGRTINYLASVILGKGIPRQDLKIAVHDFKIVHYRGEQPAIKPDYWCRRHELFQPDEDSWIHYMSHELMGLTDQEMEDHYFSEDPELREVLEAIRD